MKAIAIPQTAVKLTQPQFNYTQPHKGKLIAQWVRVDGKLICTWFAI